MMITEAFANLAINSGAYDVLDMIYLTNQLRRLVGQDELSAITVADANLYTMIDTLTALAESNGQLTRLGWTKDMFEAAHNDGSPVLLDFGAARQTLTTNRPRLAPMYTPGFAAPEQYRDHDRLGPWTDVYGTGASMFACLAAFAPQAADARLVEDHLVSAKKIWSGQYSDNLLEVIDWCLRLDPLERPQSVFALQRAIRDIAPIKRKLTFLGNLKRVLFSEISV